MRTAGSPGSAGSLGSVAPLGEGGDELDGQVGVGEHRDGLDPAPVDGVRVAKVGEDVGDVRDPGIQQGDDVEGPAHVEAAQPVLGGSSGLGELVLGGDLLPLGGRDWVGGRHGRRDQHLEPGPGDPPVGGLDDPAVDVPRLVGLEVAGPAGDVPSVGGTDLEGLDPTPQQRQPGGEVEGVGDQRGPGPRTDAEPGGQGGAAELGNLGRARPAVAPSTLSAG
ncbi:hypothetical protein [Nocardioides campestrisoli]|uniref:hypothetical protein n=1 Tax=Nocardioides campestrisoli TaxID=2736757 RepID=UPI00163DBB0F|nr:hypothetical protein [Nocardioides campestrisoli]